jgi:hypothetical protein
LFHDTPTVQATAALDAALPAALPLALAPGDALEQAASITAATAVTTASLRIDMVCPLLNRRHQRRRSARLTLLVP